MNELFFNDLKLIKKDKQQWKAYKSMENTVVIAGPGSGKTRVLSLKAVTLAKSYIHKPSGLACISYSRETVRELKKRLKLYGFTPGNRDFIGTIHSFSLLHVLQPFGQLYPRYGIRYPIKIIPGELSYKIYRSVLEKLKVDDKTLTLEEINRYRCLSVEGLSTIVKPTTDLIKAGAILFEKALFQTEYLDFTSIINLSARIIHEQPFVRKTLQSKFPWLLIDEYQDLGKPLHEMVMELLFNADIKIYAVGDMNQSIYGFNGGYPEFLAELLKNDDVTPVELDANYRSTQHIIDASMEALLPTPPAPKYVAQRRVDEAADFVFITCGEEMEQQYEVTANKVIPNLINNGVSYNEIGIIVASNTQVKHMSTYLKQAQIPFYIAKWDFENSNVVVWLEDCAEWCLHSELQSFDSLFKTWYNLLVQHNDKRANWTKIQLKVLFNKILTESKVKGDVKDWLEFVIGKLGLKETLQDSEQFPNEVDNLDKLIKESTLHNLKNATLDRFANLGSPVNEVTITTRHSAKGLEFEAVIMLGMEEEKFPYYSHIGNALLLEEDQRLCYVCVSRAKKSCILIRSKVYTIQTKRGPWVKDYAPSRFWNALIKKFGTVQNTFTVEKY